LSQSCPRCNKTK